METLIPLTAIDLRRMAAFTRVSTKARQTALETLSETSTPWWQRQRELLKSCTKSAILLWDELAPWIERVGEPVYPSHEHLAKICRCSVKTVGRGLSQLVAFGLLNKRRRRWQDARGRWHEASSLYSLPPPPPDGEQMLAALQGLLKAAEEAIAHRKDKNGGQTPSKTRQTHKKEGLRPFFNQKQDQKGSWKRPGPILSRMLALGTVKRQE